MGVSVLREAHEGGYKDTDKDDRVIRDPLLLSAAQWILWYEQSLFKQLLSLSEADDSDDLEKFWPGPLYLGKAGLSLDRCRFWRNGFDAVAHEGENEERMGTVRNA